MTADEHQRPKLRFPDPQVRLSPTVAVSLNSRHGPLGAALHE